MNKDEIMFKVYLVKSFGPEMGYCNLKTFARKKDAEKYAKEVNKQIPKDLRSSEFVEMEELDYVV